MVKEEITKLDLSISKANTLLAYATNLSKSNFNSNSKLKDLIYLSVDKQDPNKDYSLRSTPVRLELIEPLFVGKLEFSLKSKKQLFLSYVDTSGKKHSKKLDPFIPQKDHHQYWAVASICNYITEFSISTNDGTVLVTGIFGIIYKETSTSSLSQISLANHLERLHLIQKRIKSISSNLKARCREIEDKDLELQKSQNRYEENISKLQTEIDAKTTLLEELKEEITSEEKALNEIKSALAESSATLSLTQDETKKLETQKTKFSKDLENLTSEVHKEETKLTKLQRDVDVFSEDLRAFTGETRKQQAFYGLICLALLVILVCITISLFDRAGDLISYFEANKIYKITDVVISRIPFSLAVLGIVTLIAEGIRRCINQVIIIHHQRLAFLRLSIVARDVIDIATQDTELNQESVVRLRTKLKLAMLRQHMEKDLGDKTVNLDSEESTE